MPHHIRRRLRDHVVSLLAAGVSPALLPPGRVLKSRVRELGEDELPAILVYALRETAARQSYDALDRVLELAIDIRVAANDGLDDMLDGLAAAVEVLMDMDPSLGGLAQDSMLAETEIGLAGGQGVVTNGAALLKYRVRTVTPTGQPGGIE
ncbi:hypothetical protein [Niveispirillum fermenti]|uniref:hypothetical protein n=1 Tax=Niveispirillum fermenti TaxID=1233113 RepID=UPI003A84EC09